ncbi:MAG: hypothetical protein ACXWPS_06695 [Ktedonobacteraceae bacterium]
MAAPLRFCRGILARKEFAPMRIGLLASNASLAEYFVTVTGLADHTVTLYSAKQDLFSALAAVASLQGEAPHDVLLLELIVDASGGQTLARLNGLARELELRIIVLTTAGRDAITLTQPALPALCLRQLPLPPTGSACGVPSCTTVRKWSRGQRNRGGTYAMQLGRATFHKMWKVGRSTEEGENLDEVRQRGAGATRKACTAATCRS